MREAKEVRVPLRRALLRWFDAHARDLPWRRTHDAYRIWVSEVMLQQTQVDRVVRYWQRFLEDFPTVHTLAAAELQDVLSLWSGLGYYSRARNLHRAAQEIVSQHGGVLPRSVEALRELPGFGRYTAGAVASIAYGEAAPLVDGNVARVLSRLLVIGPSPRPSPRFAGRGSSRPKHGEAGESSPPPAKRGEAGRGANFEKQLWAAADVLVPGARPGDWNQALMELGATVCTPSSPSCPSCPVRRWCGALEENRVHELPVPKKAAPRKQLVLHLAVARRGTRVLLARREEQGLFGGLWELPPSTSSSPEFAIVRRTLTHRDLELHLHTAQLPAKLPAAPAGYLEWRWVPLRELPSLGMSSAMHEAIAAGLKNQTPKAS